MVLLLITFHKVFVKISKNIVSKLKDNVMNLNLKIIKINNTKCVKIDRAKNQLFRLGLNMPKVSRFSKKSKMKAYNRIILLISL